ncbi:hypothetical protein BBO01nite_51060 [Brevibacillus borstelensis]|nr:hypothetical protein BBO01nite_51060 [Brevibacillus borstelensis]
MAERESEGFIVPMNIRTTQPYGGKEPCFVHGSKEVRVSECK